MTKTIRTVVLTIVATASLSFSAAANAGAPPSTKALQAQVKALQRQVAALKAQVEALEAGVKEASATATAARDTATGAATKTNCLVNGTALVLWSDDIYGDKATQTLYLGTGLDIATATGQASGYVAGVNPSCVPSVFPRAGQASFAKFRSPFRTTSALAQLPR